MAECSENDDEICRFRGDTYSIQRQITQEGSPSVVDITGFSYLFTVNTTRDPDPTSSPVVGEELFQIVGVLTDPGTGRFEFPYDASPNPAETPSGSYFYDIQQTDGSGLITTIAKGKYKVKQDITK